MKSAAVIVLVCGLCLSASAGPTPPASKRTSAVQQSIRPTRPNTGGGADALPFSDNFDSYVAGSNLGGQGGWQKWEAASVETPVSNTQSTSPSNSLKMVPSSDVTQQGSVTSGKWELKCKTFYPSTNVGPGANDGAFIIGMNQFDPVNPNTQAPNHWSGQIQWHPGTGVVRNYDLQTETTPIVTNQWVPFRMVIDLGTDKWDAYYNGVQLVTQRAWSTGVATGGTVTIAAFDFFSGNLATTLPFEFYIDDISFSQVTACYANCDGSTAAPLLTANDFQCFLNKFATSELPYANCDGSTAVPLLTANDFQCFLNAYATGCT